MSTDIYAGQLCGTHVNEWITHPDLDPTQRWLLLQVRHRHDKPGPMLVTRAIHPRDGEAHSGETRTLQLAPDTIVAIDTR